MYAELQVTSNFSFLRGASHPQELVARAHQAGLAAIAITDRNSLAGIVRGHGVAKKLGLRYLVGARLDLRDAPSLLCYPMDRTAYGRLTRLLTLGRRRAPKGECHLDLADVLAHAEGQVLVAVPDEWPLDEAFADFLRQVSASGAKTYLAGQHLYRGDDAARLARLDALGRTCGTPLLATNDVHYHLQERCVLQDVLTCIREGCTIFAAGLRLHANAERHIKTAAEMARLFRDYPDALARTLEVTGACRFSLDELRYEYPAEPVPAGRTPQEELVRLTWLGAASRYPQGIPPKVRDQVEEEFRLIVQLDYARYFLTVHDIVGEARARGILCQGRGSAANSAVCYCLGITSVDPAKINLLFARFISADRNEPPDIDVDFEHERREEIIQYLYEKYGRHRAGLAATVITYRTKSAIRDVGKALGLSLDAIETLSKAVWGWGEEGMQERHIRQAGLNPDDPMLARALLLAQELHGFPRHLSQHVGGFVITRGRLDELVPIENAAMQDRTVIEWDKDDLDTLGMLKIDVLALGMLSCLAKSFALIERHYGPALSLATVPQDDPDVYAMLSRADTIGVFQVESRAQMTMLPRLKPKEFYDLVIEVAIVRPGPIQGDMVHPYLRRRDGREPIEYPSPELKKILERTKGVPLFQEQCREIAIVGAGFSPSEADQLRRAMATFRHMGTIGTLKEKFISGMLANGYGPDFVERCFRQIEGFGEYGFPESHAASFALLVYVSAWVKHHYPAVFTTALLNSLPMGFYAPAQLVGDARKHDVEVRPPDVNHSLWDADLEPLYRDPRRYALRMGLASIKGISEVMAARIVDQRGAGYATVHDVWRRAQLPVRMLALLAAADAFASLGLDRRQAYWAVRALGETPLPLFAHAEAQSVSGSNLPPLDLGDEPMVALPVMPLGQNVLQDYATLSLSLKAYPVSLIRATLQAENILPAQRLGEGGVPNNSRVKVAGLVLVRQRPGTASGVIFATLEDETGIANIIVWPKMFERFRRVVLRSTLWRVDGRVQREGLVIHVIADRIYDYSEHLQALDDEPVATARALARADEVSRPGTDQRQVHYIQRRPAVDQALPPSRDFH